MGLEADRRRTVLRPAIPEMFHQPVIGFIKCPMKLEQADTVRVDLRPDPLPALTRTPRRTIEPSGVECMTLIQHSTPLSVINAVL